MLIFNNLFQSLNNITHYIYYTNPADIYRCPVFFTGFKVAKFEFAEDKTPSKRPLTYMSAPHLSIGVKLWRKGMDYFSIVLFPISLFSRFPFARSRFS